MNLKPGTVFRARNLRTFVQTSGRRTRAGTVDLLEGEHVIFLEEKTGDDVVWWFMMGDGEIVRDGVWNLDRYGLEKCREMGFQDLEEVK